MKIPRWLLLATIVPILWGCGGPDRNSGEVGQSHVSFDSWLRDVVIHNGSGGRIRSP